MERINEKWKFSSIEVKAIMKSLLCGVEEMHKHKIMHRDLKPDNILFRYHDSY
jgi:calcium/calmodulin-dependent protein kinase I